MTIGTNSSSKPAYAQLQWFPAQSHVVVADEAGVPAIARLLKLERPEPETAVFIRLLGNERTIDLVPCLSGSSIEARPDDQRFCEELRVVLSAGPTATRLYVAGTESFLALVRRVVRRSEFPQGSAMEELTGSGARKAQCVHCKTIYRDIVFRAFDCPRCEAPLIVRDHYSRRIGAYQAVVLHPSDPNLPALRREQF